MELIHELKRDLTNLKRTLLKYNIKLEEIVLDKEGYEKFSFACQERSNLYTQNKQKYGLITNLQFYGVRIESE